MSLLEGLRVLDLTDEKGQLCGRILADLGAEVIKTEKPGGDESRNIGPFYHDETHPEKSLFWFAYNRGKKGITLNLQKEGGKEIFQRLTKGANCIIESFPPGYLDGLGLGYEVLAQWNPSIILTSITPFGQTGPYKDFKAPDVVAMALAGYAWLNGYPDRAPMTFSIPQAYSLAGIHAAAATLIASYHCAVTGEGQHVDVSVAESPIWATQETIVAWDLVKWCPKRQGMARENVSGGMIQYLYPCKDGSVSFHVIGGKGGAQFMKALTQWMKSEGMENEYFSKMEWESFDLFFADKEMLERVQEPIREFFKRYTKEELYREAIKRRIMLFPASTIDGLLDNEQLKARGFWKRIEHPELNTSIVYPGTFYCLSEESVETLGRAPLIGEHNQEILGNGLGYSDKDLMRLKETGCI